MSWIDAAKGLIGAAVDSRQDSGVPLFQRPGGVAAELVTNNRGLALRRAAIWLHFRLPSFAGRCRPDRTPIAFRVRERQESRGLRWLPSEPG